MPSVRRHRPPAVADRLILVGLMGAGKTTGGRKVAKVTGHTFVDLDRVVEEGARLRVAEIFATEGETSFRRRESDALAATLAREEPMIIATGGGVVVDAGNRSLLAKESGVVWLKAGLATLARRVGHGSGRPLLADDPVGVLEKLMAEREPLYREVASSVIEVDHLSSAAVVDRLVALASSNPAGSVS